MTEKARAGLKNRKAFCYGIVNQSRLERVLWGNARWTGRGIEVSIYKQLVNGLVSRGIIGIMIEMEDAKTGGIKMWMTGIRRDGEKIKGMMS